MKKLLLVLLVALIVGGAVFAYFKFLHVEDPSKAYLRTVAAAMLGDEEVFLEGFTEQSRPLVAGLLALSAGQHPKKTRAHPYHFLVTENVEEVTVEGEQAWVRVRRMGSRARKATYDIPMKKVEGTWQIDALQFTAAKRQVDRAR